MFNKTILFASFIFSLSIHAADKSSDKTAESKEATKKEISEIIQKGCAADLSAAGCKSEDMECLRQHAKTNKDFKVSDSCNEAKKQVREKRRDEFKNKFKEKFKEFQEKRNSGKKDKVQNKETDSKK